jgi:hypothetical protein
MVGGMLYMATHGRCKVISVSDEEYDENGDLDHSRCG